MGSEIFQFGLGRAEKFGFKDFNFALKILENTGIAMNRDKHFFILFYFIFMFDYLCRYRRQFNCN